MKNNLLLILILFVSGNIQSQEMLKEGNFWLYETLDFDTESIFQTYFIVDGDTIINGTTYKNVSIESNYPKAHYPPGYILRENDNGELFRLDSTF